MEATTTDFQMTSHHMVAKITKFIEIFKKQHTTFGRNPHIEPPHAEACNFCVNTRLKQTMRCPKSQAATCGGSTCVFYAGFLYSAATAGASVSAAGASSATGASSAAGACTGVAYSVPVTV